MLTTNRGLLALLVIANMLVFSFVGYEVKEIFFRAHTDGGSGVTYGAEKEVPITKALVAGLPLNTTLALGDLFLRVSSSLPNTHTTTSTRFSWSVLDAFGTPVTLNIFHLVPMHTYFVKDDLRALRHVHPTRARGSDTWDGFTALSPGTWHLTTQLSYRGSLYHLTTPLTVRGTTHASFPEPNLSLERSTNGYTIRLTTTPHTLQRGVPARLAFEITPSDKNKSLSSFSIQDVLFASPESEFVWNTHGNRITDAVSGEAGFPSVRTASSVHPYAYDVTFPRPGVWLIDLEATGGTPYFYLDVKE